MLLLENSREAKSITIFFKITLNMKRLIKKDIITFVCVLCCSACTLNTKQNDKHLSIVKPKDNIVTLRGEMILLGDTLPGVLGIVVADKYILTVSDERTPLFTALTKKWCPSS